MKLYVKKCRTHKDPDAQVFMEHNNNKREKCVCRSHILHVSKHSDIYPLIAIKDMCHCERD